MSAIPETILDDAIRLNETVIRPYPNSDKVYVGGSRADLRVPMRQIHQADTRTHAGGEPNPAITVYDTSGPYTDPAVDIDLRRGLPAIRAPWIEARADTEVLSAPSSEYGRRRAGDAALAPLRFAHIRPLRRARPGRNVSQMHYARRCIITPDMEFVAIG